MTEQSKNDFINSKLAQNLAEFSKYVDSLYGFKMHVLIATIPDHPDALEDPEVMTVISTMTVEDTQIWVEQLAGASKEDPEEIH